ncbi:hypothetical protein EUGRSUZ_K02476 [Eucalyptus grandis]|uniref:Uncharacterized protein n=2 Tax=Eucalyptus grandis TaxID=71139 RepID=A0ACC3IYN4_EUCGR|nr:hypothetical protein EUGRSUZ_K02476 [Eucalyptus grandis]
MLIISHNKHEYYKCRKPGQTPLTIGSVPPWGEEATNTRPENARPWRFFSLVFRRCRHRESLRSRNNTPVIAAKKPALTSSCT